MKQYFRMAYDSVRREVLCNILIQFGILMKIVRLTKMCLNETYIKVHLSRYFSYKFLIQNGLKR
jgi:hypothetical protein